MSIYKIKKTDIFIYLLFIFIIFPWNLTGQYVSHRDSFSGLYKRALRLNNDSLKLKYLHLLAQTYMHANTDSLKILSDSLLSVATSLHNDKYTGIAYKLLGNYYSVNFRMDSARNYFKKSLQFSEKAGDSMTLALVLVDMGNSYTDYVPDSALYYYQKALKINKAIDNQHVFFIIYYNLGVLMNNHEKPQKAMDYFLLAAKYADSIHYVNYHGYVFNYLGILVLNYLKDTLKAKQYFDIALKDFEQTKDLRGQSLIYESLASFDKKKAIHYSLKALALIKQVGDKGNITVFSHNIGMRYLDRNQPDSAEFYLRQSVSLAKKYGFQDLLLQSYRELGRAYMLKKEWKKAKEYLEKSWQLAQKDTVLEYKIQALYYLSDWAKATQNFKQAYDYYTRADSLESIRDSLVNVKAIKEVETQYQTEKKEKEILQLQNETKSKQLALEKNSKKIWILGITLSAVLLFFILLGFFYYKLKQKKNIIELLQRDLHHRVKNNLSIISAFVDDLLEKINDPELKTKLIDLNNRIQSINELHRQLYKDVDITGMSMRKYVDKIARMVQSSYGNENIEVKNLIDNNVKIDPNRASLLGLVINEFITNSFKHAFEKFQKGKIFIELIKKDAKYILRMKDNGAGLPDDFHQKSQVSFGMDIFNLIAKQLNGKMHLSGKNGVELIIEFTA